MSDIIEPDPVFHRIHVRLMPNNLPSAKGTFIAKTSSDASLSIEQVCVSLKKRGGFTGNYTDLVSYVKQYFDEAAYQLCNGYTVDAGYFSIYPVLGGVFNSAWDEPDRKKHPVRFRFRVQPRLAAITQHITIEIDGEADTLGSIVSFTDFESGSVNETASPGNIFSLYGARLKISGNDPRVGVYFVSGKEPEKEVKVERRLVTNTASRITGIVPHLESGEWKARVITQYTVGGSFLKDPRIIESPFTLNV